LWLVVAAGVEGEFSEEFSVFGDDADFEVCDEEQDSGAVVTSS
jgi:hypothetical protein